MLTSSTNERNNSGDDDLTHWVIGTHNNAGDKELQSSRGGYELKDSRHRTELLTLKLTVYLRQCAGRKREMSRGTFSWFWDDTRTGGPETERTGGYLRIFSVFIEKNNTEKRR